MPLRLALPADGPLDFLLTPAQAAWLDPLGLASLLAVPLRARGEVRGVLGLARYAPAPSYTAADQVLLEDLARRAALVLDNARLYTEAQQAIQVREDFLSIASHELKTPLTGLRLQMQVLLRQAREGSLPPGARLVEVLERAERQIKQLNTLINRLLDLALGPAGPPELQLSQVDMAAVARRGAEQLNLDLNAAGCPLLLETAAPELGRWDEGRVEQVVTNLLGNALKYGRGRPIHLCVRVEGDQACLEVRDEGIGIAPQDQARIFDRFERAVAVRHYGGFGLGLYITRQIVEAHGGTIQVESAPGQGATFRVCLPLAGPPPAPPLSAGDYPIGRE
jgi:signal transduction histidine kinase